MQWYNNGAVVFFHTSSEVRGAGRERQAGEGGRRMLSCLVVVKVPLCRHVNPSSCGGAAQQLSVQEFVCYRAASEYAAVTAQRYLKKALENLRKAYITINP